MAKETRLDKLQTQMYPQYRAPTDDWDSYYRNRPTLTNGQRMGDTEVRDATMWHVDEREPQEARQFAVSVL